MQGLASNVSLRDILQWPRRDRLSPEGRTQCWRVLLRAWVPDGSLPDILLSLHPGLLSLLAQVLARSAPWRRAVSDGELGGIPLWLRQDLAWRRGHPLGPCVRR